MSATSSFSEFSARLRELICVGVHGSRSAPTNVGGYEAGFNELAAELFALQFEHNEVYRRFCEGRGVRPERVGDWRQIPAIPTAAFKELEISCLLAEERTAVFLSSGTTEQRPSRHFHNEESLAIYEASLWAWFEKHVMAGLRCWEGNTSVRDKASPPTAPQLIILTPPWAEVPHSSLVHMFETVLRKLGEGESAYVGRVSGDGSWIVDGEAAGRALRRAEALNRPVIILGTALLFLQLLDDLAERGSQFQLPAGSRALETGGYKGRSRGLPRRELHSRITASLGVVESHIVCEYGMSELSSQAYDRVAGGGCSRPFSFPPWARVQIVSPETGEEVGEGESGLIRVFDLANVYSVMAIQTEDLGVRRGDGFELIGRAALAEPRGCSLMTSE